MSKRAKWWLVASPEYGTVIPIMDDGTGPMEYQSDVVNVQAATPHEAKVLAVRAMRKWYPRGWCANDNPMAGKWTIERGTPQLEKP